MERLCPVKAEDTGGLLDKGVLRESITITGIEIDSNGRGVRGHVGFTTNNAADHVALWIEYGHRIVVRDSVLSYIDNRGRRRSGSVQGFVAPNPFMRKAFEASRDAAVEAFVTTLNQTVKRLYPSLPAKAA